MRKRILSTALTGILITATLFSGCGKKSVNGNGYLPGKINELGNNVANIDDISDWTGKKLDLSVWVCQDTNAANIGKKAKDDVFGKELTRISGVSWNPDKSFDNNGGSPDTRIAKILATNSLPDIAINLDRSILTRLAKEDMVYDLTDLIPKYATNFMSLVNCNEIMKLTYDSFKIDDKRYFFKAPSVEALKYWAEDYDEEKYSSIVMPEDSRKWVWVRDDILKAICPNAKTQTEIKEQYVQKGYFTKEDLAEISIASKEEFRDLLIKINNLNITENGRKVWPAYTHNGADNWGVLTVMNSLAGAGTGLIDYFGYYDVQQGKIVQTTKQPWFKEMVKFYNELINEGLASKEALVDNKSAFEQKKNNGEYAVILGTDVPPKDAALKAAGKDFSYRKVLIDIPMEHEKFIRLNQDSNILSGYGITIFKNNIKEEDLEQIIRYFDFFYSDAGLKFAEWGPKKAGTFEETEDKKLVYTNKELEKEKVYDSNPDVLVDLGYNSWPGLSYFVPKANKYSAKVMYDDKNNRNENDYLRAWRYSAVEPLPSYPYLKSSWSIWVWTPYVDGLKKFWNARQSSEDALKFIFTAKDDDEFGKLYAAMLTTFENNGLTDEVMADWNKAFEDDNAQYINSFKSWKED